MHAAGAILKAGYALSQPDEKTEPVSHFPGHMGLARTELGLPGKRLRFTWFSPEWGGAWKRLLCFNVET